MRHGRLPTQEFRRTGQHRIEPQRRLMAAVLQTVLDDVRGPSRRAAGRHAHEQARAYVASTDRSWPFSFENVCEAIGIDADLMREQLSVPGSSGSGVIGHNRGGFAPARGYCLSSSR
jgi:hypothetical protein